MKNVTEGDLTTINGPSTSEGFAPDADLLWETMTVTSVEIVSNKGTHYGLVKASYRWPGHPDFYNPSIHWMVSAGSIDSGQLPRVGDVIAVAVKHSPAVVPTVLSATAEHRG